MKNALADTPAIFDRISEFQNSKKSRSFGIFWAATSTRGATSL